jgi:hypothetical protein
MAGPKHRRVHFFQPYRCRPNDDEIELQAGFWPSFHKKIGGTAAPDQFVEIRGTEYRGAARHCAETGADYLYLGRKRDAVDFPESSTGDDDEQPLILDDGERLMEPCYLHTVDNTENIVATLRSSGGSTISAVETWLSRTLHDKLGNDKIKLRPIVRYDQMDRLNRAQNIAKFSIKLDKHQTAASGNGGIAGAMQQAYSSLEGGATMAFEWSFGRSTPDASLGQKLLGQAKEILATWENIRSAEATIISEEDGETRREIIDFLKDNVTFRVTVGETPDVVQSPEVVTRALMTAAKQFRELDL